MLRTCSHHVLNRANLAMKKILHSLPTVITLLSILGLSWLGIIPQLDNYHAFADQTNVHTLFGVVPHAIDVLSNLFFVIAALFGLWVLGATNKRPARWGYVSFFLCLLATSLGSSFYHWAPDDQRLFWDRLPIALACASLLVAVRADIFPARGKALIAGEWVLMMLAACASVYWWRATGDLRWYLLLQVLTLCLIPLWQAIYAAPMRQRRLFGVAILCYILAKLCESFDHAILQHAMIISGHSLKHIFAALAAMWIAWSLRPTA